MQAELPDEGAAEALGLPKADDFAAVPGTSKNVLRWLVGNRTNAFVMLERAYIIKRDLLSDKKDELKHNHPVRTVVQSV